MDKHFGHSEPHLKGENHEMIVKTSFRIGPEMRKHIREAAKSKPVVRLTPDYALGTAFLLPSQFQIAGSGASCEVLENMAGCSLLMAWLNNAIVETTTLRQFLRVAHRMSSLLDFVGVNLGLTVSLYDDDGAVLIRLQIVIDRLSGVVKDIKLQKT